MSSSDSADPRDLPGRETSKSSSPNRTTAPPIRYGEFCRRAPEGTFNFDTLIPGEGPRELEVGFGHGRFLIERAHAAPGSRLFGIEIKSKWGHLVEQRRIAEGLNHVVAVAGDAREILPRLQPDAGLTRAYLHFPDPWWKTKHQKRRVLDELFLSQMARLLHSGGELFVQSDVEDRAIDMRDQIVEFEVDGKRIFDVPGGFDVANPYGARSNREARADEDGLPVFRVIAIRR
jgi:tRNA (guanine-N7-)-methyltransferase